MISSIADRASIAVCAVGIMSLVAIHEVARWQLDVSWRSFVDKASASVELEAEQIGFKLNLIASGLRTMSLLPGVRNIDRHGTNLDANSKGAIQQVYNNLAMQIDLSEVYIMPAGFNPEKPDPVTGKLEEPIVMFDELILNAGKYAAAYDPFHQAANDVDSQIEVLEVETFEYEELARQVALIEKAMPVFNGNELKALPMFASTEVITCDNTDFVKSGKDEDRQGVMFSVPFYRESGAFGGTITAIIRSNAIRALLPDDRHAITTPKLSLRRGAGYWTTTNPAAARPSLFVNGDAVNVEISHPIGAHDPEGTWELKKLVYVKDYQQTAEFSLIKRSYLGGSAGVLALTLIANMWIVGARRRNAVIQHRATHDSLTELPNRRLFESKLSNAIARGGRGHGSFVFYLDLDRFKAINDTFGHHAGDIVIVEAAKRIRQCIRSYDVLARIGGDEFVILLAEAGEGVAVATRIADRIIAAVSEPMSVDSRVVDVGISIGIASVEDAAASADDVIRQADLALYRAKSEERGSYRFYDKKMDEERLRRQVLTASLKSALENNEFELHYQHIVDAKTAEPIGCEALLRWNHPGLGQVSPLQFISLAEETGHIHTIGDWVLHKACMDAMKLPSHYHMAVNVSPVQLQDSNFPLRVMAALNQSGLESNRLELEFTEGMLLAATNESLQAIQQLRSCGVNIAIDDFGIGFSSLGYLTQFEFDRIKIDRSFIGNIENTKNSAVFNSITNLGISLGLDVTAEGVETDAQLQVARQHGCTDIQGFLFSKPKKLEILLEELRAMRTRIKA